MLFLTLKRILSISIAFIVFGIIDNGIMVLAGSAIDHFISSKFGLSTMTSAGFGNTVSDVIGIIMGRYTEKTVHSILPRNDNGLSNFKIITAEAIGICIGCIIGMSPLLFMK